MQTALLLSLLLGAAPTFAVYSRESPITRVVQLLNGMSEKIELDGEKEENLYETYVCWAKTVIDSKSASNEKGQSRIDSLEAYVADLAAGRVELTSERKDLEKELSGLLSDIETANALREQEKEDFEAAKAEMEQAITALEDAVDVLDKATEDNPPALLTLRSNVNAGLHARAAESDALSQAVELGSRYLSGGDARFLRRLLTGDVPINKDWKKLNRKATFKKQYVARSGKIQKVLAQLLETFKGNLKDAEDKEAEAVTTHETLLEAKTGQKDAAQEALNKEELEGGARGMSKEDSEQEITDLKTQLENDEKYIDETKTALKDKKKEYTERKALRVGEVKAISEAISILHSDDARDNFKRSFKSQGYSLLQVGGGQGAATLSRRRIGAANAIRAAGNAVGDSRLISLAARLAFGAGGHFDKVIEAIDKMISKLEDDEKDDIKNKEDCEKDRTDDTKTAIDTSREVDELSQSIETLEDEIVEIEKSIKEKEEEIDSIEEQLKEAKRNRDDENTEWTQSDEEDKSAKKTVEDAVEVLEAFYKENLSFIAKSHAEPRLAEQLVAGEAPPPPPATWEKPYGGETESKDGVVGIMQLIAEDIGKDITKAKTAEDDAQTAYDTFKTESETQIDGLKDSIDTLNGDKTQKEDDIKADKEERATQKGSLGVVIKKLKDAEPGCNFVTVNFKVRSSNRQIETDGLKKAKEILAGATDR